MTEFRVIDVRSNVIEAEQKVVGSSPEDAARQALGIDVFRSGPRQHLVARVYWQGFSGPPNMVRLYSSTLHG